MRNYSKICWHRQLGIAIFITFAFMLVLVVVVAYSRPSGVTGLDMAKIRQQRQQLAEHKSQQPKSPTPQQTISG